MLYDSIAEVASGRYHTGILTENSVFRHCMKKFNDVLKDTPKHILTPQVVTMVETLADKRPSSLIKGIPICFLPYDKVWVEYSYNDLIDSMKMLGTWEGRRVINDSLPPSRIGYLFENLADGEIRVTIAWAHTNMEAPDGSRIAVVPHIALTELYIDTKRAYTIEEKDILYEIEQAQLKDGYLSRFKNNYDDIEAFAHLHKRLAFNESKYMRPWLTQILMTIGDDEEELRKLQVGMHHDIAGEWRHAMAILMVLNSKNCIEYKEVDRSKLSKRRIKSGKPPSSNFKEIHFKLTKVHRNKYKSTGNKNPDLQKHLVCAHLKIRKTGIFIWLPFIRGYVGEPNIPVKVVEMV